MARMLNVCSETVVLKGERAAEEEKVGRQLRGVARQRAARACVRRKTSYCTSRHCIFLYGSNASLFRPEPVSGETTTGSLRSQLGLV